MKRSLFVHVIYLLSVLMSESCFDMLFVAYFDVADMPHNQLFSAYQHKTHHGIWDSRTTIFSLKVRYILIQSYQEGVLIHLMTILLSIATICSVLQCMQDCQNIC